jgi:type II secretory pathway component PulJ
VSARLNEETGFTLVEMLTASMLMIVVLGSTLTALTSFQSNAETNARQNDAQDTARRGIAQLARDLRNLASPTNEQPEAIKRASAQDLIVQSVAETRPAGSLNARNAQYVRYCYSPTTKRVMTQRLTWTAATTPAFPTGTDCPASGWATTKVVADSVVNDARPLFVFNGTSLTTITEISTALYVDPNPGKRPRETTISTTVFLRNQNRVPIARFSAAPGANGTILLNGAASEDPEERALTYEWYDKTAGDKLVGQGIVFTYTPPSAGSRQVYLTVRDPANLPNTAAPQTVCVPGPGVTC